MKARLALLALICCAVTVMAADPPGTVEIKLQNGKSVKGVLLVGSVRIKTDVGILDVNQNSIQSLTFAKDGDTLTTKDGVAKGQILTTEFKLRVPLGMLTVTSDTITSMTFAQQAPIVRPPVGVGQNPPPAVDVPAENQLTPLATVGLDGNVTGLALTPDGKYLLLLNQTQSKLQRFDLAARKLDGVEAALTAGSEGFGLARKGDLLYTFASPRGHNYYTKEADVGKVQIFESPGLKLAKTLAFDFDPFNMAVHDAGYLFFSNGSNQWTAIGRLDIAKETVEKLRNGVRHRSILRMTPDQSRLYYSSTDTSPGSLECVVLPAIGKKVEDKEIAALIDKLKSENFNEREEATRALEKIGEHALPALKKAADSDDGETRTRARRLLEIVEGARRGNLLAYRAPYHGDQPLGGRFEIAADGQHIICTGGCVLSAGREQDKDLRFVVKVEPHLVACSGKEDKLMFAATSRSTLLLYSYPEFALKRTLLLKGVPREMIYDEVGRCLYAFVPAEGGKSGSLHVYDLRKFVSDK